MYYIIKVLISAILIVGISELSKRSSLIGAILASIPFVSVLAFIWIYVDTKNVETISKLSYSIFWLVIPSLVLFVILPIFLKYFKYRNAFAMYFYFTTLFNGGLVPWYILMIKYLKLKNNLLSLIIPSLLGVFYIIIMRSFMSSVPDSLGESAKIDGAGEFKIFAQIYMPLSKPALASIGLFYALGYWNNWSNAMLFITDTDLYPLQFFLYNMLMSMQPATEMARSSGMIITSPPAESFKLAMTIVATGPIVLLYPFAQKYFITGITIGAVKG